MKNTTGLRKGGPGRPKGSRNQVPTGFKASIKRAFEEIATEDPELIRQAIIRGLSGKPRESFMFVQLAGAYIDGKPADTVNVRGAGTAAAPWVIVLPPGAPVPPDSHED